jgi:putative DNA primase/helicase
MIPGGHTPWWFGTNPLPWVYEEQTACPFWDQFVLETFGDDQVKTAQQMFGALLSPHNKWQKLFWLLGKPRTGKGVFQAVAIAMVGAHNHAETSLRRLNAVQKGNEHLIGKRFITLSEAGQVSLGDMRSATGFLQKATGGDPVDIPG